MREAHHDLSLQIGLYFYKIFYLHILSRTDSRSIDQDDRCIACVDTAVTIDIRNSFLLCCQNVVITCTNSSRCN